MGNSPFARLAELRRKSSNWSFPETGRHCRHRGEISDVRIIQCRDRSVLAPGECAEWVAGGPVEPRLERLLDYFAVAAVLVVALVVVIVFDEIVKYAREEFSTQATRRLAPTSARAQSTNISANKEIRRRTRRTVDLFCIRTHLELRNNRRAERIARKECICCSRSRLDLQPASHRPLVIGRLVV